MNIKRSDLRNCVFPATCVAFVLSFFQVNSQAQDVVWLPQDATWRFFQTGFPEEIDFTRWFEEDYDETGWGTGVAELGFDSAANSETTLLTRGRITYYFRTTFMVTQAQLDLANQLQLNLVRDDGAVIYINGNEVRRDNMPTGRIDDTTLAERAVAGTDESRVITTNHLSSQLLTVGENLIAVEIHQNSSGSSDVSFSLGIDGFNFIPILGDATPPAPLAFNNSAPRDPQYSPILNQDDDFEIGWWLDTTGESQIHFVHPDEVVDDFFPDDVALVALKGSATLVTDVSDTDHRDNDVLGAYLVNLSNYVDVSVQFGLRGYIHIPGAGIGTSSRAQVWLETSTTGDTFDSDKVLDISGGVPTGLTDTLVADSDSRRVLVPTSDIGTTWRDVGFNDSAWTAGTRGSGYDTATTYNPFLGSNLDLESQLRNVNGTLYMRVPFDVADKDAYTNLVLCMRFDDGFAAYINGQLVESKNAPGSPAFDSEATSTNSDKNAVLWEAFDITDHLDALVDGPNILAIHGLNSPKTSSDMLIAAELKAFRPGGGGGGNLGEPEFLDDISGPIDGPFTVFSYDVPDTAQTLRMRFQLNCNTGENLVILDNILVTGTPLTVQSYSDYISLNTDFDPDDEGNPNADPDGDAVVNLLEYAFGGSPTEPEIDLTPTSSVIEIDGQQYFALTWRQQNSSFSGGLGTGEGGFTVRDITYVPRVLY